MAGAMDKGLMALMGIDDDMGQDEGLLNHNASSSFFDNASDSDQDTHDNEDRDNDSTPATQSATPPADARTSTASKHEREQQREHKQAAAPAPHRASTSSLFASSSAAKSRLSSASSSSSSPSSSSLFSPDHNPFSTGSPTKVRVNKSPKKTPRNSGASSMFSPTLSPRKPKRSSVSIYTTKLALESPSATQSSQSQSSSTSMDLRVASPSPPLKPRAQRDAETDGLASPVSSFQLKKKTIAFSDSDDSDISPLEDNPTLRLSSVSRRNIALNASFTSDAEMDIDVPSRSSQPPNTQSASKAAMSGLLEELSDVEQEQEQGQHDKAPEATPAALKTPPKSNRPVTIALDDDSEDETQEDVERRKDEARWKLDVSRALLVAPISKEQRLEISRDLQVRTSIPPGKRLEVERALQMSPLSNKIQNMSLDVGSPSSSSQTSPQKSSGLFNRRSSLKSPSKSQRPGTVSDIHQYNEMMKRELAKRNLERRKQLEMEAKKSGTWKSPEEYAAEQLRSEDQRTKGLDPDEDEDADDEHDEDYDASKDAGQQDVADDNEEAMELNSGDEAEVLSGESDGEEEGEHASKLAGQDMKSNDEDNDSMDSEDDDEDEGDNEGEDDDEEDTVQMRRTQKKTNVIGDEDDVKVVIVDRSQAPTAPDSDDEAHESASQSGSNNGHVNDSDDDVSDLEQDVEGDSGTQGFGAFFEASYDPSAAKKDTFTKLGRANAPALGMASTHSPVIASDPNQSPTLGDSQTGLSQSMAGALDFLSGNFPSATPNASSSSTGDKLDSFSMPLADQFGMDLPTMSPIIDEDDGLISSSLLGQVQSLDASMDPNSVLASQKPRNAFDVLAGAMRQNAVDGGDVNGGGLRRLQKRAAKPARGGPVSKNDKSAYIEYEAEEEEDEHMGMGGVDYESENDNDDYDLGDGMVDTNVVIDSKDAENVRQLHMKHEQVQHDKDISDLVQGIAAGGLWKRNKGQMDDLDLFDEEDMDGRFRRKKKLKVSEKIEKLADNPKTAAYARAFRKDKDDDLLVFLSDPDESNDEADSSSKAKSLSRTGGGRDDEDMASLDSEDEVQPVQHVEESEDEDEMLNTDKRKDKLRQARLLRDADGGSVNESMESGALTAMTKGQALPFGDSSSDDVVSERTVDNDTTVSAVRAKKPAERREPVDEYEDILRRKKVIQDIIDGVEDPVEQDMSQASSQRRRTSSSFSAYRLMDRIVDRSQLPDPDLGAGSGSTSAFGGGRAGPEVDVEAIVRPRALSRQNSSFMCEERKARFLSTVGEESRGANAGNRVVKEVNRRRMAFATSSKQDGASTASTSSSSSSTTTVRGVASQPSDPSATSKKGRTGAVPSGPSRLLKILTVDEE
ncbi:hypothetical protein BGZ70_001243 [Mortierella alpina]|uniref:DNA replication checkpoint mediator MRC1 domain-containing protein n=1 Tax=Mortierella alpina TaxID=64518 RepID=A0A9P6LYA5_MORAP|nr:hypothetical protein BGZ70_001243 [Mortierella alpina]